MARARNIKPGFFTNDDLAQCEYGARLLFAGLWTIADREGRLEDRPAKIKAQLFPYDGATACKNGCKLGCKCCKSSCNMDDWLMQLAKMKFIVRYECGDSKYIQINNFRKHQSPHVKEPESTIPASDSPDAKCADCGLLIADTGLRIPDTGLPKPETGNGDLLFEQFWESFPRGRKGSKQLARKAWATAITKTTPARLIESAVDYAASPVGRGEFVKGPAPWLNQECWDDDRESWNRSQSSGKPAKAPARPRIATVEELKRYNPITGIEPLEAAQ